MIRGIRYQETLNIYFEGKSKKLDERTSSYVTVRKRMHSPRYSTQLMHSEQSCTNAQDDL